MAGEVRSVVVRLSASVGGYLSGMGQADAATAKVEQGLTRLNKKTLSTDQTMSKIGKVGGRLFLGAAAGIAVAEKKAADFNAEMATVYTLSHANTRQQEQLAKAAKTVGINIGVGATDAAKAEEELIKAGVSLKDIMGGGLKGALDLASAGQTDVASATEVAASAMTQFNLKGKDVPHIADLLAAGADKALGSVTDLGYGLSQVGTQAHQMGFSIEDTVGTLAEFAQSGLTGERGGTVLKQMFLQLAAPTDKASKLMKRYGLSLYDANGQIKTMPELADNLQRSFKNLTPAQRNMALGVIFGSRAIQGANILIKDGEKKNRAWIKSVNDQGFAAHQASGKMDSLKGDLKKLGAALDNSFIDTAGDQSGLRGLVKDITSLVKAYNRLSESQKGLVLKGFEGAAAVGGSLWVANKIYAAAKGTAGLYRGIGALLSKKTAATVAGDALGGSIGRKGVVPVFVTNEGFGGAGAPGKGGGVPAVVGTAEKAGKFAVAGRLAVTAGTVLLAGALSSAIGTQIAERLGQVGNKGKEPGVLGNFDKPRSTADSLIYGGTSHSLKHDAGRASSAQKFGGVFSGLDQKLAGLVGGDGLTKSLSHIKELDKTLASIAAKDPKRAQEAYADALDKSGLSAAKFAKILPKATYAMSDAAKHDKADGRAMVKTWTDLVGAATEQRKVLKTIPKQIRAYVSTPGAVHSLDEMRRIAKQYNLTPKQILTVMRLQGYSETQAQIAAAGRSFRSLPKQVKTALRADTVKSIADVKRLQKQYNLTPAQKRTVMQVSGVDKAIAQARALRNEIAAIKSKSINITIHRGNAPTGPSVGPYAPDLSADGSTVPKTGRGYADRHHYLLADGEEITSNRYGQADRYRPVLKAINADFPPSTIKAMLADGGTAGGGSVSAAARRRHHNGDGPDHSKGVRGRLKKLEESLKASTKAVDKEKNARDSLVQKRSELVTSVRDAFTSDPFGTSSVWAPGGGSADAIVRGDTSKAKQFETILKGLASAGLKGDALASVAQKGDVGQAQALLAGGKKSILGFQSDFQQRAAALNAVASFAGTAAYGSAQATANKHLSTLVVQNKHLTKEVAQLRKELAHHPAKTGHAVAKGVNHAAAAGKRKSRRN